MAEGALKTAEQLTEREQWLMRKAFIAGWDANELRDPGRGMDEWLSDVVADAVTVKMALTKEAPAPSLVRELVAEVKGLREENASLRSITKISIPTATMEQEFRSEWRKGYQAAKKESEAELTALREVVEKVRAFGKCAHLFGDGGRGLYQNILSLLPEVTK